MEHQLTLTLPDEIFQPLIEAALQQGRTLEEIAVERLAVVAPNGGRQEQGNVVRHIGKRRAQLNEVAYAQAKARLRLHAGAVNSGDPNAADNERIDADLARAYGDPHETDK